MNKRLVYYPARARIYDIKITIGKQDELKIRELVKASPVEISLKMMVKKEGNHFHLYNPICFKQRGSKISTRIDLKDEDRYLRELLGSGRPFEEIKKEILSMRCWIHSHVERESCWWSQEDNKNCERLNNGDYYLSIVVIAGKKDSLFYNCRLDFYEPKEEVKADLENLGICRPGRLTLTDLFVEVVGDGGPDFDPERIKKEAEILIKEKIEIIEEREEENDDAHFQGRNKSPEEVRRAKNRAVAARLSVSADYHYRRWRNRLNRLLRACFSRL